MISGHFVKKKMVLKSPFLEKNDLKGRGRTGQRKEEKDEL
jgi:hypothetical protein